mmetsp:Transcript_29134/g.38318  ORF Transcript_29134/g.38318 Transcript_29134/m.38318 type:complete len:96 (-) Transcript_29134:135-422(-)
MPRTRTYQVGHATSITVHHQTSVRKAYQVGWMGNQEFGLLQHGISLREKSSAMIMVTTIGKKEIWLFDDCNYYVRFADCNSKNHADLHGKIPGDK